MHVCFEEWNKYVNEYSRSTQEYFNPLALVIAFCIFANIVTLLSSIWLLLFISQFEKSVNLTASFKHTWHMIVRLNNTSWVAIVSPTDRPKSVTQSLCNRRFLCCHVTFGFFVDVGAFVIGLSHIFSFFSYRPLTFPRWCIADTGRTDTCCGSRSWSCTCWFPDMDGMSGSSSWSSGRSPCTPHTSGPHSESPKPCRHRYDIKHQALLCKASSQLPEKGQNILFGVTDMNYDMFKSL